MKKPLSAAAILILLLAVLISCSQNEEPTTEPEEPEVTQEQMDEEEETAVSPEEDSESEEGEFHTTVPVLNFEDPVEIPAGAVYAVAVIGAWVDAGAPETEAFDYVGYDGNTYQGTFEVDVLPLFTEDNVWYAGSPACSNCHHGDLEISYHEMDLSSYEGIMAGGDRLEAPPGEPLLGESEVGATDYHWEESEIYGRLHNNRMPPESHFDITEENRDGPTLAVNGAEVRAVDLIGAWVDAGMPETEPFAEYEATFAKNVLPLFTEWDAWYEGSPPCSSCHHGNLETSYHEMDLSSYEGLLAGGDRLEDPPGEPIWGESEVGATDYNWEHSEIRERLRNNRMPPGAPFEPSEANRDGPLVLQGEAVALLQTTNMQGASFVTGDCKVNAVHVIGAWVDAGAPEGEFSFVDLDDDECVGEFAVDILPLFTEENVWYSGSPSCSSCHHSDLETAYHEMDLSSHEGFLGGEDRLEDPPGVPILGETEIGATDFNWEASEIRARLRDNRMPPGAPFDITEENRDGPTLIINGTEVRAVNLIGAWIEAGAPETEPFAEYEATFAENVLPLFTEGDIWYEGAPSCSSCHHGNLETSFHEMDLSSYEGLFAGADRLEDPPGEPLFGESEIGATDYSWEESEIRHRLRDNRMPPGSHFDSTEGNRDGPVVYVGYVAGTERGSGIVQRDIELIPPDRQLINDLVVRGACHACHVIPGIEGAVGVVGPDWCEPAHEFQEGEEDLTFLYESILAPNALVEEGYPANVMPQNFGDLYSPEELDALVAYIATLSCTE